MIISQVCPFSTHTLTHTHIALQLTHRSLHYTIARNANGARYNNIAYHYNEDPPQTQATVEKILSFLRAETEGQESNFDGARIGKTKVFMKYVFVASSKTRR